MPHRELKWEIPIYHERRCPHKNSLMSANEGFTKAVSFLKEILLSEETGQMWWAWEIERRNENEVCTYCPGWRQRP